MFNFIKPEVLGMKAYHLEDVRARIKLNQNENPYDLPAKVKRRALEMLAERPWGRYPEFIPTRFLERLGQAVGWPAEGLAVGNGSNELIAALLAISLERGRKLLTVEPTFAVYRQLATVQAARLVAVSLRDDLTFDVAGILKAAAQEKPEVMILCSPNNPTGSWLAFEEIEKIASGFSGLIIVDEAYHEFSKISAMPLIRRFRQVAVLRTFSKAMSLAGLRVGYLIGAPELVQEANKAKLPYNLDIFSIIAATCALDAADEMRAQVEAIISERERLLGRMPAIEGVRVYPSKANFILFETPVLAAEVYNELLSRRGILIRNVSRPGRFERALRVSVGRPDENDEFVKCLEEIVHERASIKS